MRRAPIPVSPQALRRLAVTKQRLAGPLPSRVGPAGILSVVRDLAYVQWDPVTIVAPSHLLSLWNRLGPFRRSDLERLLWKEKKLFEHWTPIASLVLTEDYPLYYSLMRRYPESLSPSWGSHRVEARRYLAAHDDLRRRILRELREGPRQLREFSEHARTLRSDGEWTPSSDVARMLFHLSMAGDVMVVGHRQGQNLWGLADAFLPDLAERRLLPEDEVERLAALRAIRALGTATPREITYYFVRGRYEHVDRALADLERDSQIHRVVVEGFGPRDERYVHDADLELLRSLGSDGWRPRMSLLPPFDNLICSTARTRRIFDFEYVREQFLPAEKRRYGTYVLPILWGDRLIGRIDPRLDQESGKLKVLAVHAEPGAPKGPEVVDQLRASIESLAGFVGARGVSHPDRAPPGWKDAFR